MIVNEWFTHPNPDLAQTHFIEFGISTWTQNELAVNQTQSIRRAVYNEDGVFSPHGSSEIPMEDMSLLIRACIGRDMISRDELVEIQNSISESLQRTSRA